MNSYDHSTKLGKTFPVGWVGGWLGGLEKLGIKLNSARLQLGLGLSLAIRFRQSYVDILTIQIIVCYLNSTKIF